ncbi:MAG: hypothetical protein ACXAC8_05635 [Candidatus Hodarchaeales archaeon]|jgi:hypothetical protein
MGSAEKINEKDRKKSADFPEEDIQQSLPNFIRQELDVVREEIKHEIHNTTGDLKLMMRGIQAEIETMKKIVNNNQKFIESISIKNITQSPTLPEVKEVSTGLDLLYIPSHLRRTFETILKFSKKVTAKEVAKETNKSRSLESDYLNQLTEQKFIKKEPRGKKVVFYHSPDENEEEIENGDSSTDEFLGDKIKIAKKSNNSLKN